MELARKLKPSDVKRILGPNFDFNIFCSWLRNVSEENNGKKPRFALPREQKEFFNENEFAAAVVEFMLNCDSLAGDFARLNSYGIVTRDGQDCIVLIDFGITNDSYQTHYAPKAVSSYYN
jgi:hypothetical protein